MHTVRLHLPWETNQFPSLFRQTPNSNGVWKDIQFCINEGPEPCDFLVVFAGQKGIIQEPINKANTLFIAGEPPAIKRHPKAYLAQFGSVICSDPELSLTNKQLYQQGYPWFCGIRFSDSGEKQTVKTYDDFKKDSRIEKTKLLSVVCSDKCSKPGHRKRFEFVKQLKEAFGDELDLFGTGQNPIADKTDAIRPYKYHIAIENSSAPDYWTEKLADCYLEEAFPFYAGCPNLNRYFPDDAYTRINLNDPAGAIRTIRQAITENRHKESVKALHESKQLVLDHYNLFNLIADHITNMEPLKGSPESAFSAYPSKWFRKGPFYRLKFRFGRFLRPNLKT
jgi:hypothetical protein